MTAGASYEDLSFDQDITSTTTVIGLPLPPTTSPTSADFSVNKFNPKLGLTWRALENTTLRAAAFQTVARNWSTSQTIEPTQVAGFNQFYNDAFGTKSTNYGLALDQVFTADLAAGVEYSWRDLTVPNFLQSDYNTTNWDLDVGRAYLYWTPALRVAASAEYLYEDFKLNQSFTGEFPATQIHTQRVPLTVNYFHPLGYFARLRTTYIDQEGEFTSGAGLPTECADDGQERPVLAGRRLGRLPPAEALRIHQRRRKQPVRQEIQLRGYRSVRSANRSGPVFLHATHPVVLV